MEPRRNLFDLFANPWVRMALEALAIVAVFWLLHRLSAVLTPLLVGLVLAYILDPLVTFMTRRRFGRTAAASLVFGSGGLVLIACFALAVPMAWQEGTYLYRVAIQGDRWEDRDGDGVAQPAEMTRDLNRNGQVDPSSVTQLKRFLEAKGWLKRPDVEAVDEPVKSGPAGFDPDEWLRTWFTRVTDSLRNNTGDWFGNVGGFLGAVGYWLLTLLLVPIYAYFFSINLPRVSRTITEHIPIAHRDRTLRILAEINRSVGAFFRGRIAVCAVLGVVAVVGFAISGVPSFLVLGVIMGVGTAIPLAAGLVLVPVAALLYLDGASGWQYVVAGSTYLAVQALEPVLITVIMGKGVEMHPVLVLIAILAFGSLLGAIGVLLAVPLAATARILMREFLYPHVRRLAGLDQEPPALV
ncbi:MAG TPA: AI-2E family transporter [Planctomycetota bacterium]|nr:AI-2E family transporter [Planctomycetota bacterium]